MSWAQRELASAWRAWDALVAARAAATAMARRALYAWSGNELLGAVTLWRKTARMAITARQHGATRRQAS